MYETVKSERFRDLLANERLRLFSEQYITESYMDCAPDHADAIQVLLSQAFSELAAASHDSQNFAFAIRYVVDEIFQKHDPDFWFNRLYLEYKHRLKPHRYIEYLRPWLIGNRILDLGCGNGLTAWHLAQAGYEVGLTDILDYRAAEARGLPFVLIGDARSLSYSNGIFDTGILLSVLHHVVAEDLVPLLRELQRVCRHRLVIEEDTFALPSDLEGLADVLSQDPQLRNFMFLSEEDQLRYTMFLDYFGNVVTQGLFEMEIPFEFKPFSEWKTFFSEQGFRIANVIVRGFQK